MSQRSLLQYQQMNLFIKLKCRPCHMNHEAVTSCQGQCSADGPGPRHVVQSCQPAQHSGILTTEQASERSESLGTHLVAWVPSMPQQQHTISQLSLHSSSDNSSLTPCNLLLTRTPHDTHHMAAAQARECSKTEQKQTALPYLCREDVQLAGICLHLASDCHWLACSQLSLHATCLTA